MIATVQSVRVITVIVEMIVRIMMMTIAKVLVRIANIVMGLRYLGRIPIVDILALQFYSPQTAYLK